MEQVAAAQLAAQSGATLACIDAPLPLQERWVEAMVADFARRQKEGGPQRQPLPYELLRDAHMLQTRLPPGFGEWDARLARAFAGLGASALLAFKLARASAAATLGPAELPPVVARLRRLQALKWQHFSRRELHMAWRLRELCEEGGRDVPPSGGAGTSETSSSGGGIGGGAAPGKGGGGVVVVALVGRQHAAALRALWEDKASPLWRDEMPRGFSPSVIEEINTRAAAAAEVKGER